MPRLPDGYVPTDPLIRARRLRLPSSTLRTETSTALNDVGALGAQVPVDLGSLAPNGTLANPLKQRLASTGALVKQRGRSTPSRSSWINSPSVTG